MNRPHQNLVRRVRELALMVELDSSPKVSRTAMLTHLTEIILKHEAECLDEHRGEEMERNSAEGSDSCPF